MNVLVKLFFDPPTDEDWREMRDLAQSLTNNRDSIRIAADPEAPNWLVAEFTMPTEAQYKAVDKIYQTIRTAVPNRQDTVIGFPRTAAEEARARRKNERNKARRKANKA